MPEPASEQVDGPPLIQLSQLSKSFHTGAGAVPVLRDISLKIRQGEFVALMGKSGSGKTTLMNVLGCLDQASTGSYVLEGRDVAGFSADQLSLLRRDSFGFIFQRYNLIPSETALANVEIPAIYAGVPRAERIARASALLAQLGMGERLAYRPAQLSGGQQQRISIARALMNGGRIVLADEPTGALDSANGAEVLALLKRLHQAGHTIILITHALEVAQQAERIIEIKDGRIVSDRPTGTACLADKPCIDASKAAARQAHLSFDIAEAGVMALRSLRLNLSRTILTLLGIIIGVGAVVAMLALGDGSKQVVLARIEAMGTDLLMVRPGAPGVRGNGDLASLVEADAQAIAALPNVRYAVPEFPGAVTLRVAEADYQSTAISTSADYARAHNWPLAQGTFFSVGDVDSYAPFAVLGQTAARNLFPQEGPSLGRHILVNNIPFQVIGVLAPKGASANGGDMDDVVVLPLSTARMRLFGKRFVRSITVQVDDVAQIDATQEAVFAELTKRHLGVDFQIRNMQSLLESATQTQDTLTVMLGSIAAISLLVGGIGVMNIMLVSVTERTREIGIRMATGAQMHHIMLQFMIEALIVCLFGGAIGIAGGLLGAALAAHFGAPVVYSLLPILLAFGSATAVGLLFGFLPARRAARLNPVVALSAD